MNRDSVVQNIVKAVTPLLENILKDEVGTQIQNFQHALELRFDEIIAWSHRLDFVTMPNSIDLKKYTIPLDISIGIRKYGGLGIPISTNEMLSSPENYLLLGDPGAGKTTTLKRMVLDLVAGNGLKDKFPVLIRLKELKSHNLYCAICDVVDLKYKKVTKVINKKAVDSFFIGTTDIHSVVPLLLKSMGALLILDGYDEIKYELKDDLKIKIIALSRHSASFKILLTSRHGEILSGLEGFTYCELQDLAPKQVERIVHLWSNNPSEFLKEITVRSYKDLKNRPLFLNYLILYHNRKGFLPSQSNEVVDRIIKLLIEDWNEFQNVKRKSAYADFYETKKVLFLAELAFELTFIKRLKYFMHHDLVAIYKRIHARYRLNIEDASAIMNEIESHTGLIIQFNESFEFTHLVLQEYLAAYHLSRLPFSKRVVDYFDISPAVVAITVSMSSDPGLYFASLFLSRHYRKVSEKKQNMQIFLLRILYEGVDFNISADLGFALVYLFHRYNFDSGIIELLDRLVKLPNVLECIAEGMKFYYIEKDENLTVGRVVQRNHLELPGSFDVLEIPEVGGLSLELYRMLNARE